MEELTPCQKMAEAVSIFLQHNPCGGFNVGHDELFAPSVDKQLTEESVDGKRLMELGWYWHDEFECWSMFT